MHDLNKIFRSAPLAAALVCSAPAWAAGTASARSAQPQEVSGLPPEEPAALTLTWDDCVRLAAERNPALVAAEYAKKASRLSYEGSYNGLMPSLSLTNTYNRNSTL